MKKEVETQVEKQLEEKKQETFIGRDLLENYRFYRNYISSNPVAEYIVKRKCIEIGKELLPMDLDNTEEQKKINDIYDEACDILETEIPAKRNIIYSYFSDGKTKFPIYKLSSADAKDCQAEMEKLDEIKKDFVNQQHEQHIGALTRVDNQVFHMLVKHDIVKKHKPTITDILNKKIKERFEKGG